MTEQATQPNNTPTQEAPAFEDIEARIDAEIAAEYAEKEQEQPKAEQPAEEEPHEEEEGMDVADLPEDDDAEDEEPQPQQRKRRKGEAQRLKEKLSKMEEQLAAAEAQNAQYLATIKQSLTKTEEKAQEEKEFEPIDEEAFKRTQSEIEEVKLSMAQQRFADKFDGFVQAQKATNPNWEAETRDALIIHKAHDLYRRGLVADEHEAVNQASAEMARDLAVYYQKGKPFADYFKLYSEEIQRVNAKNKRPTQQRAKGSDVNMAELDKLRKSAGAPTNKVAPVNVTSSDRLKQIDADLAKEKASGDW